MTRLFIMLPEFEKQWAKMGLSDEDLKRLQYELLDNPKWDKYTFRNSKGHNASETKIVP